MTTLKDSSAPTFRTILAMARDLLVIGLCLTLLAGFLLDLAAAARPVQNGAVPATSVST